MYIKFSLILLLMSCIYADVTINDESSIWPTISSSSSSPFTDIILCPIQLEPWKCSKQQFGRMLDIFETVISHKTDELKAEADANYDKSIDVAVRTFSETDIPKQKPSSLIKTIENYLTNGINNVMGREKSNVKGNEKKKKPITDAIHINLSSSHHGGGHEHDHDHGDHNGGHDHNGGGHDGIKHKKKHGRSIEGRGKKKKKKKAIIKLLLVGAVIKAKIELLLKLLATHLQIKFFVIAFLGLLINLARFWFDLKKGHQPQKVIYYEHAQHQHHYDEHDDSGWGSGGYWKRSLNTKQQSSTNENDADYVEPNPVDVLYDEGGYNKEFSDKQVKYSNPSWIDPQILAYNKQIPNHKNN